MYRSAEDVASAALRILDLAASQPPECASDLELAAATVANHVADWHFAPAKLSDKARSTFKADYPEWDVLRGVSNGTKHASLSRMVVREPEWEDDDFWYAPHRRPTLFVDVDGTSRSVHGLVYSFCTRYLERAQ